MATARKRWFRVADSVGSEPWSNDVLATCIRLQAYLNTRWARDGKDASEAGRATLRPADLMAITGCARLDVALCRLRALALQVSMTVVCTRPAGRSADGQQALIDWPKFAEFQGFKSEPGAELRTDTQSRVPPPRPASRVPRTKEEEDKTVATPSAPLAPDPPKRVRAARKPPSPEASRSAALLSELLAARGVPILRSHGYLDAWGRELDRLARDATDVRASLDPWLLIEAGIRWVCGPENAGQYALVVESGKSLREKWPRIAEAAKRARKASKPQEAMDEWMRTGRVSTAH